LKEIVRSEQHHVVVSLSGQAVGLKAAQVDLITVSLGVTERGKILWLLFGIRS